MCLPEIPLHQLSDTTYMTDFIKRLHLLIDDILLRISHANPKICSEQCQLYQGSSVSLSLLDKRRKLLYSSVLGDCRIYITERPSNCTEESPPTNCYSESFPYHHPDSEEEKSRILNRGGTVKDGVIESFAYTGNQHSDKRIAVTLLRISRSIGDFLQKQHGVIATPFVKCVKVSELENSYLLMSSDGLKLTDKQVQHEILFESGGNTRVSQTLCDIAESDSEKRDDNETAILVHLGRMIGEYDKTHTQSDLEIPEMNSFQTLLTPESDSDPEPPSLDPISNSYDPDSSNTASLRHIPDSAWSSIRQFPFENYRDEEILHFIYRMIGSYASGNEADQYLHAIKGTRKDVVDNEDSSSPTPHTRTPLSS